MTEDLDIQSWPEIPTIAHFCSLFREAFGLIEFDMEQLEESLLLLGKFYNHEMDVLYNIIILIMITNTKGKLVDYKIKLYLLCKGESKFVQLVGNKNIQENIALD